MNKAVKEAKIHGSWINPDAGYDEAVQCFVRAVLSPGDGDEGNRFLPAFAPFAARIAFLGQINSLAQVTLKLTSPGTPDIYQGNELWDFSLVDPDNRRPVDYERRQEALSGLPAETAGDEARLAELLENGHDGRIKLFVTSRVLHARRDHGDLFSTRNYTPLGVEGAAARHLIAFARQEGGKSLVVTVPRHPAGLAGEEHCWPLGPDSWGDAAVVLPDSLNSQALVDVLTGRRHELQANRLPVGELLRSLPVAVLLSE